MSITVEDRQAVREAYGRYGEVEKALRRSEEITSQLQQRIRELE